MHRAAKPDAVPVIGIPNTASSGVELPVSHLNDFGFDTGKPIEVARYQRPDRTKEYWLLAVVIAVACVPYLILASWEPRAAAWLLFFAGYFQVLGSFASSSHTNTSHHIRFLLAGSNPIGMTGSSSLIFGAVDAIVDWGEDQAERRRRPVLFWLRASYKFFMTPSGLLLMAIEFGWDALLLRRPRIVAYKWSELFSLAYYHDLICPEKSNDIFYADLAFARYKNDPYLYQWNRLRALVFELEHYRIDYARGVGVPETNIFWQDELTAYQTLKRLRVEAIEAMVADYYASSPEALLIPRRLGEQLIDNARPICHYLRMRRELNSEPRSAWQRKLKELLPRESESYSVWHLLRIIEAGPTLTPDDFSRYIKETQFDAMLSDGIVQTSSEVPDSFQLSTAFRHAVEGWLNEYFDAIGPGATTGVLLAKQPTWLDYQGMTYVPKLCGD